MGEQPEISLPSLLDNDKAVLAGVALKSQTSFST